MVLYPDTNTFLDAQDRVTLAGLATTFRIAVPLTGLIKHDGNGGAGGCMFLLTVAGSWEHAMACFTNL